VRGLPLLGRPLVGRVLKIVARAREEHGLLRGSAMLLLRVLSRFTGGTVLVCLHKPLASAPSSIGRLLTRAEIERVSQDERLDLPAGFVAAQRSPCYGVVIDDRVRCYAWTSSEQIRAVPGTVVRMPPEAAYVFKAFTDPLFRGRGLLRECLKAVERDAVREGRTEVTSLVELHNRSSLRAFRHAGFERCGFVLVLRWPWAVKRIGCRAAVPCTWCKHDATAVTSTRRSAVASMPRQI
jgi:ribosomal protein S18 acetylase RimI-like enzyme